MSRPGPFAPLAAVVSVAVACGDSSTATGFTTTPPTTMPPLSTSGVDSSTGTSGTSTSTSTSAGSDSGGEDSAASASGTSTASVGDVGQLPDFPTTPGCQGKIDFLFVISSFEEMIPKQLQLQEAFPDFIELLEEDFADFDYHVMVVDSAGPRLDFCDICYSCSEQVMCNGPGCTQWGGPEDYPCHDILLDECVPVRGAGVTIAGNFGASNKQCLPADGPRFIMKDDPDLAGTFACTSTLGAGPQAASAVGSMLAALEPEILSKYGCNAGFLRPDALLAIVLISGDYDLNTPGTPADWYAAVLDAKKGNEDAVVILSFSHDHDAPDPKCVSMVGDTSTSSLRKLADAAEHGQFASMCEPSYVPFMHGMAGTILELCSIFIPPQ